MLVTECSQHGQACIISDHKCAIVSATVHVLTNVSHALDVFKEAPMGTRHVFAHFQEKSMGRGLLRVTFGGGFIRRLLARWAMFNSKDNVEELNDGALSIAAASELDIWLLSCAVIKHDSIGQSGICHVLSAC
jgi:hypothetical protein